MRTLCESLRSSFKPPGRDAVTSAYLDRRYNRESNVLQLKIDLNPAVILNIDSTTELNGEGVTNISYVDDSGCYTVETTTMDSTDESATAGAQWVVEKALKLLTRAGDNKNNKNPLQRLSAIVLDTCLTNLSIFRKLKANTRLNHVFLTYCDAHGIALLIKDIFIHIPWAKALRARVPEVVMVFTRKKSMHLLLREKHKELGTPLHVLMTMVDTQWPTILGMFKSVKRCKAALREVAGDTACTFNQDTKDAIRDQVFWDSIEEIIAILTPIKNELITAQAQGATINKVIPRWLAIKAALEKLALTANQKAPLREIIDGNIRVKVNRFIVIITALIKTCRHRGFIPIASSAQPFQSLLMSCRSSRPLTCYPGMLQNHLRVLGHNCRSSCPYKSMHNCHFLSMLLRAQFQPYHTR